MRLVVVVSNNMANKHSTVITVVPLSTKINKKRNLPTHVFVPAYKSEGLEQHSIALCEQVTALDYGRIIENMGKVDKDTLARITKLCRCRSEYLISIIDYKVDLAEPGKSVRILHICP